MYRIRMVNTYVREHGHITEDAVARTGSHLLLLPYPRFYSVFTAAGTEAPASASTISVPRA